MSLSPDRRMIVAWGLAVVALVANTAYASYNVGVLIDNEKLVIRTRQVKAALDAILLDCVDAETGSRGYILVGTDEFLDPYTNALARLEGDLDNAETLTRDNVVQAGKVRRLRELVGVKLGFMAQNVAAVRAGRVEKAEAAIREGDGKRAMDAVRALADDLQKAEDALLARRRTVADDKFAATTTTNLAGGAITLVISGAAFGFVRAELRRRQQAQEQTAEARKEAADSLALLDTFVMNAPVGLAFFDARAEYIRVNQRLADAHGLPIQEHAARPPEFAAVSPVEPEIVRTVLATQAPLPDRTVTPAGPDGNIWQTSYYPVKADDGRFLGVGVLTRDVTRRVRTEQTLRESEERFRAVIDNFPGTVFVKDAGGRFVLANRGLLDELGLTADEVIGRTAAEVYPPDMAARTDEEDRQVVAAGRPLRFESTFEYRGRTHAFLTAKFPLPNGQLGGVGTDLTDRKAAEDAVAEREERFRTLASAVPQIVWMTRPDGYHDYYNSRWYEFTGLTPEQSIGFGWSGPLHPDDKARSEARWKQSTDTGTDYEIEYRFRGADGNYRWFLGLARPQRDAAGAIIRWIGTCTDVDDSRRLRDDLTRTAERFQLLTETIPNMVWNADERGNTTYVNQRWVDFTGLPRAAARAGGWFPDVHPDDFDRVRMEWEGAAAGGADRFAVQLRLRRHLDGQYRWLQAEAVPLRRADGNVDQWIGALADIHDQKQIADVLETQVAERTEELSLVVAALRDEVEVRARAERREAAAAEELRRSNLELEQFAYIASHDLQEPLRKIQSFGDRLAARFKPTLGEQGADYVDRMLASAGRMRKLIDDLLAFSRVAVKPRAFAPTDLAAVVAEVASELEVRVTDTGGRIEIDPLPTVPADTPQMRQLFQNLIANALKFRRPGVPPVVRIGSHPRPAGGFRVTVADNGIGFDEKYLDRIFQVFQRLHGRDEYEGTGVGLAICRKIVERHGGSITATSKPGEGATFAIDLPAPPSSPESDSP